MPVGFNGSPPKYGMTWVERHYASALRSALREIGESDAMDLLLSKYGNIRTKAIYACELKLYFRWLKQKGVPLTPDGLVHDNLLCVYRSDPTDVRTKRRHTDWLNEYVNVRLLEEGASESKRHVSAAAIKEFYRRNDSQLFGDFQLALQAPKPAPKPLRSEDIRRVLLALPLNVRAPLLVEWQSGIEVNRVLTMRWEDLPELGRGAASPFRINLYGRKWHRKPYNTYVGRDGVQHLVSLRRSTGEGYVFTSKRGSHCFYGWLNTQMKRTAQRLMRQGLIAEYPLASWHSHALRHSFETEASHAGVKAEIRDFFLGHIGGIQWVYNHRDELHEDDLLKEYARIEPFVSLNPTETTLRGEYEDREKVLVKRLLALEEKVSRWASQEAPSAP
ncbi:MAG: site-specific integrase [Thaumarchaeota archaeon]|nr:site-specific integrase [Nitrososphaerota archaeon]